MVVKATRINVTDTPTRIDVTQNGPSMLITNRGANTIYLGGRDVTPSNGYQLDQGDTFTAAIDHRDGIYGICDNAKASTCHIIQAGSV
jgi:hypothetical protein